MDRGVGGFSCWRRGSLTVLGPREASMAACFRPKPWRQVTGAWRVMTRDDNGCWCFETFRIFIEWWNLMKCVWNLGLDHVETIGSINFQERQDEKLTYIHQRCGWIVNCNAHLNGNSMSRHERWNKSFKKKTTFGVTKTKKRANMVVIPNYDLFLRCVWKKHLGQALERCIFILSDDSKTNVEGRSFTSLLGC